MGHAAIIITLAIAGCSSSPRDQAQPPPPPRDAAPVPSFARDIVPTFVKHCTAKDCHGEEPSINITLDLRPSAAYHQLVNIRAEMGDAHLPRVKPGDPTNSVLVHKLTGRIGAKGGKRMPIDADSGEPIVPNPLPLSFVESAVVPWILAGAPDN